MVEPVFNYDELSDTLYVTFAPGESATGIELTEHILLRLNKAERRAVGITIFEYSVVAQQTELGPRSFPLTGLAQLPDDRREQVIELLIQSPVRDILALSVYTPSIGEAAPIISLLPLSVTASAA